jgi:regulator of sigma E protease
MYWIIAVLALGLIIFVHELGHFIAARRKGIPISVFSVGFGPRLWGFGMGDTDFRISLIPLGGYVLPKLKEIEDLHRIPVSSRIAFSLGGPLANIVFATILLSVYNAIDSGMSLNNILILPPVQTVSFMVSMLISFGTLLSDPGNISGVVGMATTGGSMISGGIGSLVFFMVLINLNLAIFNLLPIPVLDGGKILMVILEKISIRTRKAQIPITVVSLILIMALMIFTTLSDIVNILSGNLYL